MDAEELIYAVLDLDIPDYEKIEILHLWSNAEIDQLLDQFPELEDLYNDY